MNNALSFLLSALEVLPRLIAAGENAIAFVQATTAKVKVMQAEKRDPTPAEWDALNAEIDKYRTELHAGDEAAAPQG